MPTPCRAFAAIAVLGLTQCSRTASPPVAAEAAPPAPAAAPVVVPASAQQQPGPSGPSGAPAVPQPPPADATPVPAPSPAPPVPAVPAAGVVREAAAVDPAGTVVALAPAGVTVVDPAVSFRVELTVASGDARLALLDSADAHVAASGSQELAATTRLTLSPAAPLTPGAKYTLRLDGAISRELHDATGKAYLPLTIAIRAAGQPPAPDPKAKGKKKGRK